MFLKKKLEDKLKKYKIIHKLKNNNKNKIKLNI